MGRNTGCKLVGTRRLALAPRPVFACVHFILGLDDSLLPYWCVNFSRAHHLFDIFVCSNVSRYFIGRPTHTNRWYCTFVVNLFLDSVPRKLLRCRSLAVFLLLTVCVRNTVVKGHHNSSLFRDGVFSDLRVDGEPTPQHQSTQAGNRRGSRQSKTRLSRRWRTPTGKEGGRQSLQHSH